MSDLLFEYPDDSHTTDVDALASGLRGLGERSDWVLLCFQGGGDDGVEVREVEYRNGHLRGRRSAGTSPPPEFATERGHAVLSGGSNGQDDPLRLARGILTFVRVQLALAPYDDGDGEYFSFGAERCS